MGRKVTYACPCCFYIVMSSGGPDSGMIAATDTFVCLDCEIIEDIVIKKYRNLDGSAVKENSSITCNECGGSNLKKWDNEKKPCPKCGMEMEKGGGGWTVYWD